VDTGRQEIVPGGGQPPVAWGDLAISGVDTALRPVVFDVLRLGRVIWRLAISALAVEQRLERLLDTRMLVGAEVEPFERARDRALAGALEFAGAAAVQVLGASDQAAVDEDHARRAPVCSDHRRWIRASVSALSWRRVPSLAARSSSAIKRSAASNKTCSRRLRPNSPLPANWPPSSSMRALRSCVGGSDRRW